MKKKKRKQRRIIFSFSLLNICFVCVKETSKVDFSYTHPKYINCYWAPGVLGICGEGKFISGSWGALAIIFRDLGSKLVVLGIKGGLQKSKK